MAKEFRISEEAMAVLSTCSVAGSVVKINAGQLERELYDEVNKVLAGIGGKWSRSCGGHLFVDEETEVREMLEGCIQTGLATRLSRNGYFPTPPATAEKLVKLADIRVGRPLRILEPSAGTGHIIDVIMAMSHRSNLEGVDAIEVDEANYKKLCAKYRDQSWLHAYPMSIFDWAPGAVYDRVIMNPPFEFLADVDHVSHAYSLLKPGGKLVSVMSNGVTFRREAKAVWFRELVKERGSLEKLPEGSFKFSGTGVSTVVVTLNR